jgi:hypothetical protein
MTSTYVTTYTRTHTATWLADLILSTIGDICAALGIDTSTLYRSWEQDFSAIKAWIEEGSLAMVVLECHQPNGTVSPVVEFPVVYTSDAIGDAHFTAHNASLARFRAKLESVPYRTSYKLFCSFNGPRTPQPGWGPGTRASTDGLRSSSLGTIGSGPHASASMRYLRK